MGCHVPPRPSPRTARHGCETCHSTTSSLPIVTRTRPAGFFAGKHAAAECAAATGGSRRIPLRARDGRPVHEGLRRTAPPATKTRTAACSARDARRATRSTRWPGTPPGPSTKSESSRSRASTSSSPCASCHLKGVPRGPRTRVTTATGSAARTISTGPGSATSAKPAIAPLRGRGQLGPRFATGFPAERAAPVACLRLVPQGPELHRRLPTATRATAGLPQATSPNHVAAGFPTACNACHGPRTRRGGRRGSITLVFPLIGVHATQTVRRLPPNNVFRERPRLLRLPQDRLQRPPIPTTCRPASRRLARRATGSPTPWSQARFNHTLLPAGRRRTPPSPAPRATTTASTSARRPRATGATRPIPQTKPEPPGGRLPDHLRDLPQGLRRHVEAGNVQPRHFFPLVGVHATQPCAACHANNVYRDCRPTATAATRRTTSRRRTPNHAAGFPTTCDTCHKHGFHLDPGHVQPLTFFPLVGVHATQPCTACHTNGVYTTADRLLRLPRDPLPADTNPNHAAAGFPTTCDTCHKATDTSWNQATFNHARLPARRRPRDAAVRRSCHSNNNYTTVPTTCFGCHLKDYTTATTPVNHAAVPDDLRLVPQATPIPTWILASRSTTPRSSRSWAPTRPRPAPPATSAATNDRADEPLLRLPPGGLRQRHNASEPRAAGFPTTCDTCHKVTDTTWTQATFNHSTSSRWSASTPRSRAPRATSTTTTRACRHSARLPLDGLQPRRPP